MATAAKNVIPVAVAQGDGIGKEIMGACLKIFSAINVPIEFQPVEMGKDLYMKGYSTGMTPEAQATVEKAGILFKGPMETPKGTGMKSINVTARKVWSTFANKRVFETFPGVDTVFARAGIPVGLTIFRENIEDTYGGIEHMQTNDVAQCRRLITRPGSSQVHRFAFETARKNKAKRITCVHKANIMKITDGAFLNSFYEMAKEYPELVADDMIVDDMCMKLVMTPDKFDCIVLPNLQGDIVSDLCAGLVGGLGLAPSANIGERISIFEAVHGTAPDIAGKNMANPTALLLSGLMMLRHLGFQNKADYVHSALRTTLEKGYRTRDLCRPGIKYLSTTDFADAVLDHIPPIARREVTELPPRAHALPEVVELKENIMQVTPGRNRANEFSGGFDIFVDSELLPGDLAQVLQKYATNGLKLTMISNRGTQVWPTGSVYTELVNHYRCRFELEEKGSKKESDLLQVVAEIGEAVRVCSLEMLLYLGDTPGFSKAQGQ
ncbi:hypothetical protein BJ742DRAFT_793370 [Cladochytrium replicatum]|nr:hypothetical protein BJ742DRAFT_793370 [Cladochytrium replicatum]